MASETVTDILEQVYLRANISENDPKFSRPKVLSLVNSALRKASVRFDPFWLETSDPIATVAGTGDYVLATELPSFHKLVRVTCTSGTNTWDLKSRGRHEITRLRRYTNQRPVFYAIENQRLKLAPTPDAVYTLTCIYVRLEDKLTDESDEPLLPAQYTPWLVLETAIMCAMRVPDDNLAEQLRAERKEWLKDIPDDLRQQRALPRIVTRED